MDSVRRAQTSVHRADQRSINPSVCSRSVCPQARIVRPHTRVALNREQFIEIHARGTRQNKSRGLCRVQGCASHDTLASVVRV